MPAPTRSRLLVLLLSYSASPHQPCPSPPAHPNMARRAAAAAAVAMAVVASGRAAAYTGFTYNPCVPSGSGVGAANKALASGDSTWLCLHINGNQTALFNPKVDVFSAVTLTGCA